MHLCRFGLLLVLLLVGSLLTSVPHAQSADRGRGVDAPGKGEAARTVEYSSRRILVRAGSTEPGVARVARRFGATARYNGAFDVHSVELPPGLDPDRAVAAFEAIPGVASARRAIVYRAQRTTNDPLRSQQYHLDKIDAEEAWDVTRGDDRIIAVVDTGVNASHEDLEGKVLDGIDLVNGDDDPDDDDGHGTAVAGIIAAATNNGKGMAGITWSDKILPVKALDDQGGGNELAIAEGIRWAVDRGASLINLSLGAPAYSQVIDQATRYARKNGALVLAASGNAGVSRPFFPAALSDVVSVGATNSNDEIPLWASGVASTSCAEGPNYGSTLDVTAPGDGLVAPRHTDTDGDGQLDDYFLFTGTSAATPVATGVAALAWADRPSLGPRKIAELLETSADDRGLSGPDRFFGAGRLNAFAAVGGSPTAPAPQSEPVGEPADTLDGAEPLSGSAEATAYPSGDQDWWSVDLPADGALSVDVVPPSNFDPVLEIYDPDLRLLAHVDSGCEGDIETTSLTVADEGTYYLGVRNWLPNASTSTYDITATTGEAPGTGSVAQPGIERAFFTWYDAVNSGRRDWLMAGNTGGMDASYSVSLASDGLQGSQLQTGSVQASVFGGLVDGPMEVRWPEDRELFASQRVLWKPDNLEELAAVTQDDLTTHAWFSWYDGVNTSGRDWVVAANPGPWATSAEIRLKGNIVASEELAPGETLVWNDRNKIGGPVEVVSERPVLASRRTLWKGRNFSEITGVPDEDLSAHYLFPWYDGKATKGSNWILLSNPNSEPIQVAIQIGDPQGSGLLVDRVVDVAAGETLTPSFRGKVGGPVRVRGLDSTKPFVATQRSLFDSGRSFEEIAGAPAGTLPSEGAYSWYDAVNTNGRDWVLVANPSATTSVDVTISVAGEEHFSETLGPGEVVAPQFRDVVGGPVEVSASGPIISSRRTLWKKDFTELLAQTP